MEKVREEWKKWKVPVILAAILYFLFGNGGIGNNFYHLIERPIFNILIAIYSVIGDFGVSIILLTILIRLLMWPLIKKQLHQSKMMRELQPELAEIKKKTKGDKMKEAAMMQELYKERDIKPASSILTMVIQLPVFIAIFQIIRTFSFNPEKVGDYTYSFMHGLNRIPEIIADPTSFHPHLFGVIDLARTTEWANGLGMYWPIMILSVLAAVFQFIQTTMTLPNQEKKKGLMDMFKETAKGEEISNSEVMQNSMGAMTKIFPIMTFVIAVNFPGAIVLYYVCTSLIGIIQTKIVFVMNNKEMDEIADTKLRSGKTVKKVQEAEIIEKKSINTKIGKKGSKVRRISS